jgi:flagellar biosynthetic protein FliR
VAYAILVNLGTGLINKLTPQIPIYFISLPFIITGGLVLMYFAIGNFLSLYADSFVSVTIGR